jgi:hypothetical protein
MIRRGKVASRATAITESDEVEADLLLLEGMRWSKKVFFDRICEKSSRKDEEFLAELRFEPTYQFAEFFYLLKARRIETEDDILRLADVHERYIVELTRDETKIARLGLKYKNLIWSMFSGDLKKRLATVWRERPGTFDQSNLARFLVLAMSDETCAKVAERCKEAGFIEREPSEFGFMKIRSNGTLEQIFGGCIREMRHRFQKGG